MLWSKPELARAKVSLFWYITNLMFLVFLFSSSCTLFVFSVTATKHKQLPAIERVLKASCSKIDRRVPRPPPVYVLIICPTKELASQIAAEANVLLKYHEGIGVQTLIGGTRFKVDQKHLESVPCQVCLNV